MPAQKSGSSFDPLPSSLDGVRCLSRREAAAFLSVSERTLYERTAPRGPIQSAKVGRRVVYSIVELTRYVAAGGGTAPPSSDATAPVEKGADQ